MFFVEADGLKNVLRITIESSFGKEEAELCLNRVKDCLLQLQPGFKVLTDLRNAINIDHSALHYIDMMMDVCNKKKVSQVIRIIPDASKDVGFGIMSIFHYSNKVHIITCKTMVEALNYL